MAENQTYQTVVWLNHGGRVGRGNPASQPAGYVPGVPSRIWAPDSWEWSLALYEDDGTTPFDCEGATVAAYISEDADGATAFLLGSGSVGADPFNVVTVVVPILVIPQSLWGSECRVWVEITDTDLQTTVWQSLRPVYMAAQGGDIGSGDYVISGAGTAAANVTVYYVGSVTGANSYAYWKSADQTVTMYWFDLGGMFQGWGISIGVDNLYANADTGTTPPETGWSVDAGDAPAPTVAAVE